MLPWWLNLLISLKVGLCSCGPEVRRLGVTRVRPHYRVDRLGTLPPVVNESSGLARRTDSTIWTHNDGGGRPMLYAVSIRQPGTLVDSLSLAPLPNIDWEDLAQDSTRLFVADLGNNFNNRQNLVIHIVDPARRTPPQPIQLRYADQTAFPPRQRNFDCEAVFYRRDSLFLLSKNRSGHQVRLYGVPARPGNYALMPLDSVFIKSMVTGAALSLDQKTLAVLTYGKVLFFDLSGTSGTRLNRPTGCLRLPRGQTEGVVFLPGNDLLISNERGRLYRIRQR